MTVSTVKDLIFNRATDNYHITAQHIVAPSNHEKNLTLRSRDGNTKIDITESIGHDTSGNLASEDKYGSNIYLNTDNLIIGGKKGQTFNDGGEGFMEFIFNSKRAIQLPRGTSADRPDYSAYGNNTSGREGQIRYNTELQSFEGHNGAAWNVIGGLIDVDKDTFIEAENRGIDGAPTNNNQLRFYTGNAATGLAKEKMRILGHNTDVSGFQVSNGPENGEIRIGPDLSDNPQNYTIEFAPEEGIITASGGIIIGSRRTRDNVSGQKGGKIYKGADYTLIIDPYELDSTSDSGDASGTVVIRGDLVVEGNQTQVNSSIVEISDVSITLGGNAETETLLDAITDYKGLLLGKTGAIWQKQFVYHENGAGVSDANNRWHSNISMHVNQSLTVGTGEDMDDSTTSNGTYSLKTGNKTKASGDYSTAMGKTTKALNLQSVAWGESTEASNSANATAWGLGGSATGAQATKFGDSSSASGTNSTAFGKSTTASSVQSVAWGESTTASTNNNATAWGLNGSATGAQATKFGDSSTASGTNSTAFGNNTTASGVNSVSWGKNTFARHNDATAFGESCDAKAARSTAFGKSNLAQGINNTVFGDTNDISGVTNTAWGTNNTIDTDSSFSTVFGINNSLVNGRNVTIMSENSTVNGVRNTLVDGSGHTISNVREAIIVGLSNEVVSSWNNVVGGTNNKCFENNSLIVGDTNINQAGDNFIIGGRGNLTTEYAGNGIVVGLNNTCRKYNSSAFGEENNTAGRNNMVWGKSNTMTEVAAENTAWGLTNRCNGGRATAWGTGNSVSNTNATVFGVSNEVINLQGLGFGQENISKGVNATVFGLRNESSGAQSTAFGQDVSATELNSTAFGNSTKALSMQATAWGESTKAKDNKNTTAFGQLTTARGTNATAFGKSTLASGVQSVAWGISGEATGVNSTAFGEDVSATALNSTAFGKSTLASGVQSVAWGESTQAKTNANSTAFGKQTIASGEQSTAFGQDVSATSLNSTAFGKQTIASGEQSTAFGIYSKATANNTNAIGYNTLASGPHCSAFGQFNVDDRNKLFMVGSGMGDLSRRTALSVNFRSNTHVDGNFNLNKSITTTDDSVKLPVSYSSFQVKKGSSLTGFLVSNADRADISNLWIPLNGAAPFEMHPTKFTPDYRIEITPTSKRSKIALNYKINYVCSHEADQTISFRVIRKIVIDGVVKNQNTVHTVFQDLDLGTAMGVTASGVYNGTWIDEPEETDEWYDWLTDTHDADDLSDIYEAQHGQTKRKLIYELQFKIKDDYNNQIDVESGITGYTGNADNSSYNMITVQELYAPHWEYDKDPHIYGTNTTDQPLTTSGNINANLTDIKQHSR